MKNMTKLQCVLSSNQNYAGLALRMIAGIIFVAHGAQNCLVVLVATGLKAQGSGWPPLA